MSTKMVAADPARAPSRIEHEDKSYAPTKKGIYEVEDHHVAAMRPHGLMTESEAASLAAAAAKISGDSSLLDRFAALEARVDTLEGKKTKS